MSVQQACINLFSLHVLAHCSVAYFNVTFLTNFLGNETNYYQFCIQVSSDRPNGHWAMIHNEICLIAAFFFFIIKQESSVNMSSCVVNYLNPLYFLFCVFTSFIANNPTMSHFFFVIYYHVIICAIFLSCLMSNPCELNIIAVIWYTISLKCCNFAPFFKIKQPANLI